jgi:hypothetical protein
MANGNINYSAVLADLEARKVELESAIAAIKNILAAGGGFANGDSDGVISPENIPVGAFLRLSIADATKKYLDMVKTKQPVPAIQKALDRGGLPPVKYTTLYAVLRRRESQFGDIIRIGEEWALSDWYPNNPNLRKRTPAKTNKGKAKTTQTKKPAQATAKKPAAKPVTAPVPEPAKSAPSTTTPQTSTPDLIAKILTGSGAPMDAKVIAERLNSEFGKKANGGLVKTMMSHDPKKRFKDVGDGAWDLMERNN